MGLFTSARLNELCQLYTDDIKQDGKIWYIDINDNAQDKHLKKKYHARETPIHKELINLGFIDYVNGVKTKRIFPELPYTEKAHYGDKTSKCFNRSYRKNCKVGQKPQDKGKKVFHSLHHNFITFLTDLLRY